MRRTLASLVIVLGVGTMLYAVTGYQEQHTTGNTTYKWSVWNTNERLVTAAGGMLIVAGFVFRRGLSKALR